MHPCYADTDSSLQFVNLKMAAPMHRGRSEFGSDKIKKGETCEDSGRIGRVEFHVLGYFRRVHETLQEGFENNEHRDAFIQNVFSQTEDQEVKLCQNQTISRILEELLPFGTSAQILVFFKGLVTDLDTVMYDRFGAHVLQTTLMLSLGFVAKQNRADALNALIMTLSGAVSGQVQDVVMDTYASHVLRTLLQVLGGIQVADKVTRSKLSRDQQQRDLVTKTRVILENRPSGYLEELMSLKVALLKSKQLKEYIQSPSACPVLAVLLLVLQERDKEQCEKVCRKISKKCGLLSEDASQSDGSLPEVLTSPVSSHLLETVIDVSSEDVLKELMESSFRGKLITLAKSPVGNFILQHLIARAAKFSLLDQIMSELSLGFKDILAANHTGVLLHLAEACSLHPAHQENFVKCLLESLDCFEPEGRQLKGILVVATLEPYDSLSTKQENDQGAELPAEDIKIKLHGSLLLQELLKFQNKRVVVNGFMALSAADLKTIACQPAGSYLLEQFMSNERIKDKKKEQIVNTMKVHLFTICCNKNGSRVVESIFKMSSIKIKTIIAEELSKKETQVHSDRFGAFVHRTCQLNQYKHRKNAWLSMMNRDDKKRKLFADVIGGDLNETSVDGNTKKRKNKHRKGSG